MLNIYYGHIGLVKDPMVFDTWFEKMNQQRKKKILQCQHAEDKQRSLLAGILASMTTNVEDFQNLQTPIVIILLTSYYLAMLASTFEGALFIKVLSYIPLISAILSPSLLVLGQIGVFDVCISIVLMIGCIYLLIKYGLRIYKVGILNYSSSGIWKKMLKSLRNK